jgi:hypothetical protein
VYQETPDTSYADAPILKFHRHENTPNDETQHTYIRFERLGDFLPDQATVTGARLYLKSAGDGPNNYGNMVCIMTAAWSTGMTWNTRVTTRLDYGLAQSQAWPSNEWRWIDVTSAVRAWHMGTLANHGILLYAREGYNQMYRERNVFSSECAVVADRPRLEVDYVTGGFFFEGGSRYELSVVVTNGAGVIEDTYIRSNAVNYAASDTADVRTYNAPDKPERILLRVRSDSPALASLAATGQQEAGRPILVEARLELNCSYSDRNGYVDIWKLDRNWDVSGVTGFTADGTTPWPESMSMRTVANVDGPRLDRAYTGDGTVFEGGTASLAITDALQAFVDGADNVGFIVGHSGTYAYQKDIRLTEYGWAFMRPTLVMVLKTWRPGGLKLLIK